MYCGAALPAARGPDPKAAERLAAAMAALDQQASVRPQGRRSLLSRLFQKEPAAASLPSKLDVYDGLSDLSESMPAPALTRPTGRVQRHRPQDSETSEDASVTDTGLEELSVGALSEVQVEPLGSVSESLDGLHVESLRTHPESLTGAHLEPVGSVVESHALTMADFLGLRRAAFGARRARGRLFLLPDPAYRSQLPWLRQRVHQLLGIDLYTAGQMLCRSHAMLIRESEEIAELVALSERFEERGDMRCFLLRRAWLKTVDAPFRVRVVRFMAGDGVVFEDETGDVVEMARADIGKALLSEIKPARAEAPAFSTERSFRRKGGLMGALRPQTPSANWAEIRTDYWLLDLYHRGAHRPLRLRADELDYSNHEDVGPSALRNLRALMARLVDKDQIDDSFKRVPRVRPGRQDEEEQSHACEEELLFTEHGMLRWQAQLRG